MAPKERNGPDKKLPTRLIKTFDYICSSVPVKLLLANITLKERNHQKSF